jgi:multidrug resistance efflux pump
MTIVLKSPRDGYVRHVEPVGTHVEKCQLILILDTSQEEEQLATIEAERVKLTNELATFAENKINQRLLLLRAAATDYYLELSDATAAFDSNFSFFQSGGTDLSTVYDANKAVVSASYEYAKASSAADKLSADADIARRSIGQTLNALSAEKACVEKKIGLMSIKAPIGGRLELRVRPGSPVGRGSIMGAID